MKKVAVAFTGPSNSGKTTLIVKIADILIKSYKVVIIKNDPKDKAIFDTKGKDSYKFFQTQAETVILSPTRTTFFSHKQRDLKEVIQMVGDFDILLFEGQKHIDLPRIAIFRDKIDESYFKYSNAIAIDQSINLNLHDIPKEIDILDLNDPQMIIKWIEKNAKIKEI